MIVKIDPNNPLTVETLDGKVLFDWQPTKRSNLTEKYFTRLHNEIELEKYIKNKGWRKN